MVLRGVPRRAFPTAENTMPWNGTPISYFCGQKKKSMPSGKNSIFALHYEDSVSYGVAVERNRQFSETGHTDRYVRIGVLFSVISVSRGVWRCPFYLKDGRGAPFFVMMNDESRMKNVGDVETCHGASQRDGVTAVAEKRSTE